MSALDDLKALALGRDPRTMRALIPGVDYHTKVFVDFYPFNDRVKDLFIPPIYIQSGKLDFSFDHRQQATRTQGGVVVDDWATVGQTVGASGIEAIFDAWEIEAVNAMGVQIDLPVGTFGSTAQLSKASLKDLARQLSDDPSRTAAGGTIYEQVTTSIPKQQASSRWRTFWRNRGIFLLDLFLTLYKSNATVFNDEGLPVLSGNIVLETDYVSGELQPAGTADWRNAFGGGLLGDAARAAGSTLTKALGLTPQSDYENKVLKWLATGEVGIQPLTYIYGKFTSFEFDITRPFQSTLTFNMEIVNSRRVVPPPIETGDRLESQKDRRGDKPQPRLSNTLQDYEILA